MQEINSAPVREAGGMGGVKEHGKWEQNQMKTFCPHEESDGFHCGKEAFVTYFLGVVDILLCLSQVSLKCGREREMFPASSAFTRWSKERRISHPQHCQLSQFYHESHDIWYFSLKSQFLESGDYMTVSAFVLFIYF